MFKFCVKSGSAPDVTKKTSRRSGSFTLQQPTPNSILIRPGCKEKPTKEKYESLVTFFSKPGHREAIYCDGTRNRKQVQWDNVALEITMPVHQSPRAQLKFVQLNDEDIEEVASQCSEEGCIAMPAELQNRLGVPSSVSSDEGCPEQCCVAADVMYATEEYQTGYHWTLERSNSDSLVRELNKPAMENCRPRRESYPTDLPTSQSPPERVLTTCSESQRRTYNRIVRCQ